MSLKQRYYTCDSIEIVDGEDVSTGPAIMLEPVASRGFAQTTLSNGDTAFLVAATDEEWAEFDAKYTNQDAQTGNPFRHRHVYDGAFVDFIEE